MHDLLDLDRIDAADSITMLTDRLNEEQKAAVYHPGKGTLIVEALAGSGKTSGVVLPRCEALYEIDPGEILVMMFGKHIKEDVTVKVKTMLPKKVSARVKVFTNHAFCLKLLRTYAARDLGLPKVINVDYGSALWEYAKWMKKHEPQFISSWAQAFDDRNLKAFFAFEEALEAFGVEKNEAAFGNIFMNPFIDPNWIWTPTQIFEFLAKFREIRVRSGNLAFHDLIYLAGQLPPSAYKQLGYTHAFVDEAQDLSVIQHKVVSLLGQAVNTLTLVGDPWQSIFRFNGARPDLFMDAQNRYVGSETLPLSTNYRCDTKVLDVANGLLAKMNSLMRLEPGPQATEGEFFWDLPMEMLSKDVYTQYQKGVELSDMAVLCRTNLLAFQAQLELFLAGIPTKSMAKAGTDHPMVKRYLSVIRVAADNVSNEERAEAWTTFLGTFNYLGKKVAEQSFQPNPDELLRRNHLAPPGCGDYQRRAFASAISLGYQFRQAIIKAGTSTASFDRRLIEELAGLIRSYAERSATGPDEEDAGNPAGLLNCLQQVYLTQPISKVIALATGQGLNEDHGVNISTLHKAKGMEWGYVWGVNTGWGYLVDKNIERLATALAKQNATRDEIFDYLQNNWVEDSFLCEEGCIAYVAYTRAKHRFAGVTMADNKIHLPGLVEVLQEICAPINFEALEAVVVQPIKGPEPEPIGDLLDDLFGGAEAPAKEAPSDPKLTGPGMVAALFGVAKGDHAQDALDAALDKLDDIISAESGGTSTEVMPWEDLPPVGYTGSPASTPDNKAGSAKRSRRPPVDLDILQPSGTRIARIEGGELKLS